MILVSRNEHVRREEQRKQALKEDRDRREKVEKQIKQKYKRGEINKFPSPK